jgi:hypothetical protein
MFRNWHWHFKAEWPEHQCSRFEPWWNLKQLLLFWWQMRPAKFSFTLYDITDSGMYNPTLGALDSALSPGNVHNDDRTEERT